MRPIAALVVAVFVATAAFAPAAAAGATTHATPETSTSAGDVTPSIQDDTVCEYPLEMTDATGETVTIDEEPEEVVALQPSDAQTTYEIGAQEQVVGMPIGEFTDYLDVEDHATDITEDDGVTTDAEQVIDLDPDVVVADETALSQEGLIDQLRDEADLTVFVVEDANSIDDVTENVALTGQLVGECEGATDTVEEMDDRLEDAEPDIDESPTAYFAMDEEGYTAGPGSFNHDVLEAAGFENIAEDAGVEEWGEIDPEMVVEADPDVIIYPDYQDEPPIPDAVEATTAAEEENFVPVNDNLMNQPGPMIVETVEDLADEAEAHESDAEGADDADDADDGDESEPIPGFGVPAAVAAALLAVGFLVRFR
ncbi:MULTISPECIES: PGF-CTERM-anchored ABC transporter substrate-binding protein [Natronorubrum]|uniref:ABC transporter substrate-binding protein n=2 Tax=Natronorubrum TaxID=134813 RepID=A0A1N6X7V8_9EURY|nr:MULTISPECIES: PGF-CTERM-anchored ABC transporter substrate-binding protein [Natronorubrum]APX96023.1 ABC transporter substrate-binding protein [Natronorubrum daqingense]SEH10745.1 iron complex transport system substrate-binding protein [Natronorubrum sediminis]SIQ98403.1 iron complex transport system substrate-binding protein [Natronorubrum daqingense]